jgi:hypothetical protein
MIQTRFVTFPRSGHHWLIGLLEQEQIEGWKYDEHHSTGNTLESDSSITAQKTHDFGLDVPKVDGYAHIIQVRNKEASIKSWCKVHGCEADRLNEVANVHDDYRERWIEKWVIDPVPNRLIVRYEDLLADTEGWVGRIKKHLLRTK